MYTYYVLPMYYSTTKPLYDVVRLLDMRIREREKGFILCHPVQYPGGYNVGGYKAGGYKVDVIF